MAKAKTLSAEDILQAQSNLLSTMTPKAKQSVADLKSKPIKKDPAVTMSTAKDKEKMKYSPSAHEAESGILPPPTMVLSGGIAQTMNEASQSASLSRSINNLAKDKSAQQSNATILQQAKAMAQNFAEASPVNELLWELGARSGSSRDEEFIKSKSFEMQQNALLDNNLELNDANYKMLNVAQSQSDFNFRLDELKKRNEVNQYISNTIGSYQQGISAFVGMTWGDPSIGLSIGTIPSAIAKLGFAARTATAFGSSVALQGVIAGVKNEYLSNYTTQDAVLDTIIGGGIDGLLAKGLFGKTIRGDIVPPNRLALSIDRNSISSSLSVQSMANRFDVTTQYKWTQNKPRVLRDSFTDVEIMQRAKELGEDTLLAITDKNVRGKIADDLRNTARAKADNVVTSVIDAVTDFAKGSTKKIDGIVASTKLTREQIVEMAKTLPEDIRGIREEITAIGNQKAGKARAAMASNMNKVIESISQIDIDVAQSLKHDLDVAMGRTKDAYVKDKKGMAFIKGKVDAMKAVENLSLSIQKTFDNLTEKAMEVKNFKYLKPIKVAKGLSKESLDRLDAIDAELGALKKRRASKNFSKEDKANAIKKLENEASSIAEDSRKSAPNKNRDRVMSNLARQKEMYERMASAMDELTFDFKNTLEDIINENYFTKADKDAFLDEITRVINDTLDSNVSFKLVEDITEVVSESKKADISGRAKSVRDSLISIYKSFALSRSKGAMEYIQDIDNMLSEIGFTKSGSTYSKGGNSYKINLNSIVRAIDRSNIPIGTNADSIAKDKNLFSAIEIESISRVSGEAGTAMSDEILSAIIKHADANNLPLVLRRAGHKGMDEKLKRLYERHGFRDDNGDKIVTDKDEIPMVRMPLEKTVNRTVSTSIEVSGSVKLTQDGEGSVKTKNGKLKLALATAVALSATGAFASNGEDNDGINFGTVMLVIVLGSIMAAKFPSIAKAIKSSYKRMTSIEQVAKDSTTPEFKKSEKLNEKIAGIVRSELMESMYRVIKNGTQQSADIANMLVENIIDYTGRNVEGQRRAKVWSANARMHKAMHTAFMEHLAENGATQSIFTRVRNSFGLSPEEVKFQESVIDFVEFGGDVPASIRNGAKAFKSERELMVKELNEAGVYGFGDDDIANFKDTHVARLYQQKNIADIASTEDGRKSLEDFFTNAIHSGRKKAARKTKKEGSGVLDEEKQLKQARNAATKLIESIISGGMESMGRASVDRYLEAMEAIGLDISKIDRDLLAEEAHFASDVISRGKNRIPMDLSKWEDFTVKINGEDKIISLGTIFDRQASSIVEKLAHQQYGISELARQTKYKSFNELMSDIRQEPNKEVRKVLETYAKSLTGRALLDYGSEANMAVGAVKQMSNVALLTSVSTTFKEVKDVVGAMFGKGGSSTARKEMLLGIRNTVMRLAGESVYDGKHTALADELLYFVNGHGGARIRKELHIRGADELTGGYEDMAKGTLYAGADIAGRIGVMWSQLMAADDFFKRIAGIYATTRLARVVHGIESMSEAQIKRYGLTPENIDKLKKVLKLNGDNEVERLGFDSWDADTQDVFRQLTDRIIMHRSTWTTLGGINTSLINNEAGRLISSMALFMNQTYNSQFVAGVKHMDADEVMNQMALFTAGFVSYSAKSTLTGREYDEKDAAINSLMMSPMMAPFGLIGMAYDPVALSIVDRTIKTAKGMIPSENE